MSTKKLSKTAAATVFAAVAFIAFAGFTFFSVNQIADTFNDAVAANKNGLPVSWSTYDQVTTLSSTTSARVINDEYVQYTTYLKNTDENSTLALTHIASYIDEEGTKSGFVPLSERSLEYTYDPSDNNSWTPVTLSAPGNMDSNFKLNYSLYVGRAGSNTDTVYFRYNVSPSEAGNISDKVAFVTEDLSGHTALTTSDNTVAFADTSVETVAAVDPSDESGEYTAPLGAFSEAPSSAIINASALGAISISPESMNTSIIIMVAALAVFACSLIVYMLVRSNSKDRKRRA